MRALVPQLSLYGVVALLGACGEEKICTDEQRLAVRVHVTTPEGLPVDRVTAEQSHEIECWFSSTPDDAGAERMYRCREQGEGVYTIRAYSGDAMWFTQVHIDANECHTTEIEDVDLVLDPRDAQDAHARQDDDDRDAEIDER